MCDMQIFVCCYDFLMIVYAFQRAAEKAREREIAALGVVLRRNVFGRDPGDTPGKFRRGKAGRIDHRARQQRGGAFVAAQRDCQPTVKS